VALYTLRQVRKFKIAIDQETLAECVHKKDPYYDQIQFHEACNAFNQEFRIEEDNDKIFKFIVSTCESLMKKKSIYTQQVPRLVQSAQEQGKLMHEAREALALKTEQGNQQAIPQLQLLMQSPNKSIRQDAHQWLEKLGAAVVQNMNKDAEKDERVVMPQSAGAGVSLSSYLNFVAHARDVEHKEREERKSKKRKGEDLESSGAKASRIESNGAGSGSLNPFVLAG
ncbi:MAG: hypothetical protein ACHQVS_05105, partial [Candidatus Babeliales bacterium]